MNRHGEVVLVDDTGREREHHRLVYGALLKVSEGDKVKAGQLLAEWDAFAVPILSEVGGIVKFGDIVEGVTMTEKLDEVTGLSRKVIVESRAADLRPRISIKSIQSGETLKLPGSTLDARYLLPGRREHRRSGRRRDRGRRRPREDPPRDDEDAGHHGRLPRVAELFEARKPKDHAIIAEIDGEVSFGKDTKGKRKVVITPFRPTVRL
jgi:DNA-directed RNA polymerase subunit beta'